MQRGSGFWLEAVHESAVGPGIAAWLGGLSGRPAPVETSSRSCRVTATAAQDGGGHGCRGLAVAGCNPCLLHRLLGRRDGWEGPAGISGTDDCRPIPK